MKLSIELSNAHTILSIMSPFQFCCPTKNREGVMADLTHSATIDIGYPSGDQEVTTVKGSNRTHGSRLARKASVVVIDLITGVHAAS